MNSKKIGELPKPDRKDVGYEVASAVLGGVPTFGPALDKLLEHCVGEPLAKRRDAWLADLGSAINDLQDRVDGFDPMSLPENESFLSCVYEATHIAMKSHLQEKREMLRNAILNSATGYTLDEVVRGRFMSCIDRFSPPHVRLLYVLDEPKDFQRCVDKAKSMLSGSQTHIIRAEVSEQEISRPVFEQIIADLNAERFISGSMSTMVSQGAFLNRQSTDLGRTFLQFIGPPIE